MLAALKEHTRPVHERVESHLGVMDPALSRDGYRRLLERFRGFYAPVEHRLDELEPWAALGLDGRARRKTPWLDRDLRALGLDDAARAALPLCARLPRLDTVPHALGCLYVMEGATLGGALISRHLYRALGLDPDSGAAFFASYGEERGPMWKAFGGALEAYVASHGGGQAVLDGAHDTFTRLDDWLTQPT